MNATDPILLIENDKVDILTLKRVMRDLEMQSELYTVSSGEAGLAFLKDRSKPNPSIIFLDLDTPLENGLAILEEVKADNELHLIPVVVLTTSKDVRDRLQAYSHCIAGYLVKPVDYNQFLEIMQTFFQYWYQNELVN
ncbi:MAG: response regulator [Chloroflexota bacterium]